MPVEFSIHNVQMMIVSESSVTLNVNSSGFLVVIELLYYYKKPPGKINRCLGMFTLLLNVIIFRVSGNRIRKTRFDCVTGVSGAGLRPRI